MNAKISKVTEGRNIVIPFFLVCISESFCLHLPCVLQSIRQHKTTVTCLYNVMKKLIYSQVNGCFSWCSKLTKQKVFNNQKEKNTIRVILSKDNV